MDATLKVTGLPATNDDLNDDLDAAMDEAAENIRNICVRYGAWPQIETHFNSIRTKH